MNVWTEGTNQLDCADLPRQGVMPARVTRRARLHALILDPHRAAATLAIVVAIAAGLVLANDAVPLWLRAWVVVASVDLVATLAWRRLSHDTPAEQASVANVPTHGVVLTGSISSHVRLDYDAGTAEKSYQPTPFVRALYRLSFQAPFPYGSNIAALQAAAERRNLVGRLTEYWLGENIVAPALSVRRETDGRLVLVTRLIRGTSPRDIVRAKALLATLTRRFVEAGLPAWQVASYNPRSLGNLIEREDGSFRIIDLESNLVTPFMSPRVAIRSIRSGPYPSFDEVDIPQLQAYLVANQDHIVETLGHVRASELLAAAEGYAGAQAAW
ncbi:MAG: hypothetical protein M0R74_17625, partial [Dehalococcoidia bacterium]|nr:hypothetical protein [Dehalococcoidia bacterium]